MKEMINVVAVSYLNTLPFIYGILNDKDLMSQINLRLEYPSKCADLLKYGEVDLGLIPIIELIDMPYSEIIGEYCIGAEGKVKTVMLYSNCPLNEISSIALDYQSRTSVMLVKILAKYFWKIDVEFFDSDEDYIGGVSNNNAGLVIGDRTFNLKDSFLYQYDLAEEWFKYTNLPFVFACWVANKPLSNEFKQQFIEALKYGLDHKALVVDEYTKNQNTIIDLERYFSAYISWDFNSQKKAGLKKFLSLSRNL
tara:strand:- start:2134 stop:2889 length:756 start_codon:yes stop_codon:yes gene_type:complete